MHTLILAAIFILAAADQRIPIDGNSSGRTFDGIGAISAGASSRLLPDYPEQQRNEILDLLFKPNYGASLQHFKVEIGGDMNSTDGSEPSHARTRAELAKPNFRRGYEWWLLKEARKRNPKIILDSLIWGAPGWVGNGNFNSQDTAEYAAQFLLGAKQVHGLDIDYTGVWNEKETTLDYIKLLRRTLNKHHLTTRLVCCDLQPFKNPWSIADHINADPELKAAIDALGVHYAVIDFREPPPNKTPANVLALNLPLWGSEDHPARSIWRDPRENDWKRGGETAKLYNENYIDRRFTKFESWALITSYYDSLPAPNSGLMYAASPWSGHYHAQTTIWVTAHTTQFAQPGWQYLDSACGRLAGKGSYVTLKAPGAAKDYSVIVETIDAAQPQRVRFETANLSGAKVHVWRSKEHHMFEQLAPITPVNNAFTIDLEPNAVYSLTTTTGQRKAPVTGPPDTPFPMPYADNFDTVATGTTPRYLSDQNGAFEAVACKGRPGRCLEQMLLQQPISWTEGKSGPTTVLGDANWTDYDVSTDARLDAPGYVSVLGRIGKIGNFAWGGLGPSYILNLDHQGNWDISCPRINTGIVKLAQGHVNPAPAAWRNLKLRFRGSTIQALIDGKPVAEVRDETYKSGMAGIGAGWHSAQFDNFRIDR